MKAKSWSKKHLSQQQIKFILLSMTDGTQYALNKLNVNGRANALKKQKYYQKVSLFKEK